MKIDMPYFGQSIFDEEDIIKMITPPRRKVLLEDWEYLSPPRSSGEDWRLTLPFEPFKEAFDEVFSYIRHYWKEIKNNTYMTFLKDTDEDDISAIKEFIENLKGCVGIRDCLPISFALDFDKADGNPAKPKTEIGKLCAAI